MADPLERYRPTGEVLARSLFDRLCDSDPDLAADAPRTIGEQMGELREALRRDLERLLNTRRPPVWTIFRTRWPPSASTASSSPAS